MNFARFSYTLNHLYILGISAVLLGAFGIQFIDGEYPCPLCILQRMAMMLAASGAVLNIVRGINRAHFGMALLGALIGACISGRQVLLHIAPGDPGYGDPVMGMHLYSWAFVIFAVIMLLCALHLIFDPNFDDSAPKKLSAFSKFTLWLFALIIFANAVAVFFEAGLNWFLPPNPDSYRLLGTLAFWQ